MEQKFSDEFIKVISLRQYFEDFIYKILNFLLILFLLYGSINFFLHDIKFEFAPVKILLCFLAVIFVPRIKNGLSKAKYNFCEENIALKEIGTSYIPKTIAYTVAIPIALGYAFFNTPKFMLCSVGTAFFLTLISIFSKWKRNWNAAHKTVRDQDEVVILHRLSFGPENLIKAALLCSVVMPSFDPICLVLAFYFYRKMYQKDLLGDAKYISQFLDDKYHEEREKKEAGCKAECAAETAKYAPTLSGDADNVQSTLVPYFFWFHRDGLHKCHYITFFVLAALSVVFSIFYKGLEIPDYAPFVAISLVIVNLTMAFFGSRSVLYKDPKKDLGTDSSQIGIWRYVVVDILLSIAVPGFILYTLLPGDQIGGLICLLFVISFMSHYSSFSTALRHKRNLDVPKELKELDKKIYTRLSYPDVFIKLALVDCVALMPLFPSCYYHILVMLLIVLYDAYTPYRRALTGLVMEWKNNKDSAVSSGAAA